MGAMDAGLELAGSGGNRGVAPGVDLHITCSAKARQDCASGSHVSVALLTAEESSHCAALAAEAFSSGAASCARANAAMAVSRTWSFDPQPPSLFWRETSQARPRSTAALISFCSEADTGPLVRGPCVLSEMTSEACAVGEKQRTRAMHRMMQE